MMMTVLLNNNLGVTVPEAVSSGSVVMVGEWKVVSAPIFPELQFHLDFANAHSVHFVKLKYERHHCI